MGWTSFLLLLCLIGTGISQRAGRRRGRFPAGKPEVVDFNCPEDFGYYPHASECSLYYVCVFGGALLESCSGGLVYSHELQTCDWPRNVQCTLSGAGTGVSTVRVTDPRTSNTAPLRAATESLTPSVSNFFQQDSRFGFDNSFSSSQNFQSSSKFPVFEGGEEKSVSGRQGRLFQHEEQDSPQSLSPRFPSKSESLLQETAGSNNRPRSASPSSAFRPITFSWLQSLEGKSRTRRDTKTQLRHLTTRQDKDRPQAPYDYDFDRKTGFQELPALEAVPGGPSPPRAENRRPPTPKPTPSSNPSRFSIALGSTTQAPPATVPAVLDPFYGDSFNYTDADYLYYYDEFVYDDYIDVAPATTAKPTVQAESFDREEEIDYSTTEVPEFETYPPFTPTTTPRTIPTTFTNNQTIPPTSHPQTSTTTTAPTTTTTTTTTTTATTTTPRTTSAGTSSVPRLRPVPVRTSGQTPKSSPTQGPPRPAGSIPQRSTRPTLKPVSQVAPSAARPNDIWRFPPKRPQSLYPRPPVDVKATKCDSKKCLLPDCFCGGKDIPGGIAPQEVPQMVLLTFDDSVNDLNKELYVELFERGRKNPNGCGITATFYVSHEWTDYSQVQNLYADGHEMASHTIQHSFGEQFSTRRWAREVAGQREILSAYGGVKMEDVRGMRAPFLAIGGNKMFKMLYDQNFTYDSSMPVYENNPPSYPYTLDYRMFHDCMIPPCPTKAYPGVWEVPMVMWQDLTGGRCSMGDACTTPSDAEGVYKMIIKNFERHYTTNRAPFGLYYHAAWFTKPHHKEGFLAFLDTITAMDDVYLVTTNTALEWTRNPVPLSQARNYPPFQCDYKDRPPKCNKPKVCNVWHNGGVRYMRTCQQCPETYPWTGRTGVQSPLNEV
ncbi:chitin deacetylase-like 5 isoform X9 [Oratosquilla oratoria]|uniref:chitin deacetylase-like 5 isoform X9 n=1 Tax=Oratosquilla oratoria TaxID=337810 RepID=UPI003F7739E2